MRKLTFTAVMSIFFMASFAFAQSVAHVNSVALFESIPEFKAAETKIQNEADRHKVEVDRQTKEMQDMFDDAQAQMEAVKDKPEAEQRAVLEKLAPVEAELQQKQQALAQYQQQAAQDLQKMRSDLLQPIYVRVQEAINKVGKAKQIGYIIDLAEAGATGIVVFYEYGTDLNPDVKRELGL